MLSKKTLIIEMKPYKLGQLKAALHDVELLENILKEINTSKEIEVNNISTEEENLCKDENENENQNEETSNENEKHSQDKEYFKQSHDKEEHSINKYKYG